MSQVNIVGRSLPHTISEDLRDTQEVMICTHPHARLRLVTVVSITLVANHQRRRVSP